MRVPGRYSDAAAASPLPQVSLTTGEILGALWLPNARPPPASPHLAVVQAVAIGTAGCVALCLPPAANEGEKEEKAEEADYSPSGRHGACAGVGRRRGDEGVRCLVAGAFVPDLHLLHLTPAGVSASDGGGGGGSDAAAANFVHPGGAALSVFPAGAPPAGSALLAPLLAAANARRKVSVA